MVVQRQNIFKNSKMKNSALINKMTLARVRLWKWEDTEYPQDLLVAIRSLMEVPRQATYTEEEERSISGWRRPGVEDSARDQCQKEREIAKAKCLIGTSLIGRC